MERYLPELYESSIKYQETKWKVWKELGDGRWRSNVGRAIFRQSFLRYLDGPVGGDPDGRLKRAQHIALVFVSTTLDPRPQTSHLLTHLLIQNVINIMAIHGNKSFKRRAALQSYQAEEWAVRRIPDEDIPTSGDL